jgi:perosamine synthetase
MNLGVRMDITNNRVPLAQPDLSGNEEKFVVDAIRSSWISSGGLYVTRFEKEFAEVCDTRASIAVSNGTVALHLAVLTLGAGAGDEVIVPSLTYVAAANAVRYVGAEPVFVDVDAETWCLDPQKIEAAITARTKGIIAVHLYGHPAEMDRINHIARVKGLWVIEDAAEAPFATYKGRRVGGLAEIGTFSFYGNKIVTSGEGGALTLNDPQLEARARMIRNQGMDPQRRYHFPITGHNFRLTNVACAILCAQLERWELMVRRRREIYSLYCELFDGLPGITLQSVSRSVAVSPWLFCILVNEKTYGHSRDELARRLSEAGIETRPFFLPLHTLPPFREASLARGENLPITEELAKRGMNLPTYSGMTDHEVKRVVDAVRRVR